MIQPAAVKRCVTSKCVTLHCVTTKYVTAKCVTAKCVTPECVYPEDVQEPCTTTLDRCVISMLKPINPERPFHYTDSPDTRYPRSVIPARRDSAAPATASRQ